MFYRIQNRKQGEWPAIDMAYPSRSYYSFFALQKIHKHSFYGRIATGRHEEIKYRLLVKSDSTVPRRLFSKALLPILPAA